MGNEISKRNDDSFTRAVDDAIRSATPYTLGDSYVRSYGSLIDSAIRSTNHFEITRPPEQQAQAQHDRVGSPPPPNTVNLPTPNPRLSNPPKHVHGEQVAAGWPSWLSAVAGEALNGWIPRRADTFEKIDKVKGILDSLNTQFWFGDIGECSYNGLAVWI